MEVVLTFDKGKNFSISPQQITKTVAPNSVSSLKLRLKFKTADKWRDPDLRSGDNEAWARLLHELWDMRVRWEVNYTFERVGRITVNGSKEMF